MTRIEYHLMRNFKEDAFNLIPKVVKWLSEQEGYEEIDLLLTADELIIRLKFNSMIAELGYNRHQLEFFSGTQEALLIAVKKVVHCVIKSVIIDI